MKPTSPPRRFFFAALAVAAAFATTAALDKGGTAYSKKNETSILTEPKPLAAATGKVGFAEALKIEEVRGLWLRVKTKKVAGWVFSGNVADEKPTLAPAASLTTTKASDTDTVAAARPLTEASKEFAARHHGASAQADIEWLDQQALTVKPDEVDAYIRDNQKGEYQP
ncbi:MAG: hypothetical protein A3G75_14370 [Verrucomicrobia bacterium RIFCSPLOWO2_12_FULL_64_8]|nr:MAG: hypothetical protein A3G75_14370 [Verrucomicrobia bacterium RIFCSPLOWO2_12_FULL_64_8]